MFQNTDTIRDENPGRAIITPSEFQEICDKAVLTLDLQSWNANALPYEIAGALITEVQQRVCRHLGAACRDKEPSRPNEERIDQIVALVSRYWTGPILVERTINESMRMVLQHWRDRHGLSSHLG
jgi:hypothetical protein